jgi:gliding motility-associated-like protein
MLFASAHASHIVGGELYYDCLGNNQYRITLKLYRDCYCINCAPFGDPEYLAIFTSSGSLYAQPAMPFPGSVQLGSTFSNPCLVEPDICVERAIYTADVTLPASTGGYDIVYQRCCRNTGVANIPIDQGATYQVHIPGTCNNSPRFNNFPPLFICANAPLVFDHSATDPDGDQLIYSLCDPYGGADANCPNPSPGTNTGCPTEPPPPPYSSVAYNTPFSASNFLNSPSTATNLSIDPQTGVLTGTPNLQGIFVVAVCVSEYRNGVYLGQMRRDFQFNVAPCNIPVANIPSTNINPQTGIGTYVLTCKNFTVSFTNTSYDPPPAGNPIYYHWDFGVNSMTSDTSNQFSPTFTYPDTGSYLVKLIAIKDAGGGLFCTDTTYAYVYVYPTFTADFSVADACVGADALFTSQVISTYGNTNSWGWDFGDGNTSVQNNPTNVYAAQGNYSVTLIGGNDLGCRDTIQKNITVFGSPNVSAGPDTSVCLNGINSRDSVQINAGGALTYQWTPSASLSNPSIGNPIARPTSNTTYVVTGTDANGCKGSDSVLVTVLDPSLNILVDDFKNVCLNDTAYVDVLRQGASNYVWTPAQFIVDDTTLHPGFYPVASTTYTLTISNYCYTKSDSVRINVLPVPQLVFNHIDSACQGEPVQLSVSGAIAYQWDFDASLSAFDISNPVATPAVSRFYYVNAVDANGCKTRDSTFVNVVPLPMVNAGNDTLVWRDTPAYLDGSTDAQVFSWSPTDYLDNVHALFTRADIPKTQSYVLFAQNDFGCVNRDTILITIEKRTFLMLPTGFSPNGDGVNDVFRIVRYLNILRLKDFSVFNRWGEQVFTTTDINEGWDGNYKNLPQELGVYVWQVVAETKDSEEVVRKGNVTLVR